MSKNKVDGVYDLDPRKNPNAKKFKKLTFREAINRNLTIMDTTALTMCMENKIAIKVFDIFEGDSLERLLNGEEIGTTITVD